MAVLPGSLLSDFRIVVADTPVQFHEWMEDGWALVVALKAMSPTCSTEVAALAQLVAPLAACNTKVLGVAADSPEIIHAWLDDLRDVLDCVPGFEVVADTAMSASTALGFVDETVGNGLHRTALVVSPEKKVVATVTYPVTNGRNFAELLRVLQAAQLTAAKRVATSAGWRAGDPVMLPPSLSQANAERLYPAGVTVLRPYLRTVAQPLP